ncbi:MAG: peptidoglycan bridge formation glycyltransferase FemA/FemB family protein [Patescibacteria group bacterium]|nr:peptidoglycan bridge formation glycyltransferase FemA/FemB family protein [Patescibacteria group bacterium]
MELRQSREWGKYLASLGWQTKEIDGCALRIKKLGPLGSIIKIQRPKNLPLEKIDEFAKRLRALFVKIEPCDNSRFSILNSQFYRPDTWPLTPSRTVFIDLAQTEDELLNSFSKDTRQTIKKSEIPGIKYQIADLGNTHSYHTTVYGSMERRDKYLSDFYQVWKLTGTRGKFWVLSFSEYLNKIAAFEGKGFFVLSYLEERLVSGCLILICDGIAYYHHAASTLEGQNHHTPYGQLWKAIREAKKRGCTKMDLEGIFDPRFKDMFKRWLNFSTFKLKWGGEVFEYPGSFTKAYNPLIGLLFKINR